MSFRCFRASHMCSKMSNVRGVSCQILMRCDPTAVSSLAGHAIVNVDSAHIDKESKCCCIPEHKSSDRQNRRFWTALSWNSALECLVSYAWNIGSHASGEVLQWLVDHFSRIITMIPWTKLFLALNSPSSSSLKYARTDGPSRVTQPSFAHKLLPFEYVMPKAHVSSLSAEQLR